MRKICVAVAAMVAMSAAFVACTNELDVPAGSAVVEGQTGRVVFNVNTGKSVSFTRGVTPEEQRLNVLSLHVFDALGQRVPGIQIEHSPDDLVNGKLSVNLPSDLMNKTGFKAYLLANVTGVNSQTESEFLGTIASTPMDKISEWGIPMASAPISLNTTTAVITAEAVMKRAMSTLFVKVNAATSGGTLINAGDFTYKIKNTRGDRGYLLKDGVSEGTVTPEVTWTPKANTNDEELLGYMYQSNGFEVEITPSVDKPELGSASRTVVVTADKANKRNKKYVLNVLPKVSESGTVDFTVTIEDWDATDGNFNVDWTDHFTLATTGLGEYVSTKGDGFVARFPSPYDTYNPPTYSFDARRLVNLKEGVSFVRFGGSNLPFTITSAGTVTSRGGASELVKGEILVTTACGGVQATAKIPFEVAAVKMVVAARTFVNSGGWNGDRILSRNVKSLFTATEGYEIGEVSVFRNMQASSPTNVGSVYAHPTLEGLQSGAVPGLYIDASGAWRGSTGYAWNSGTHYTPLFVQVRDKSTSTSYILRCAMKVTIH